MNRKRFRPAALTLEGRATPAPIAPPPAVLFGDVIGMERASAGRIVLHGAGNLRSLGYPAQVGPVVLSGTETTTNGVATIHATLANARGTITLDIYGPAAGHAFIYEITGGTGLYRGHTGASYATFAGAGLAFTLDFGAGQGPGSL